MPHKKGLSIWVSFQSTVHLNHPQLSGPMKGLPDGSCTEDCEALGGHFSAPDAGVFRTPPQVMNGHLDKHQSVLPRSHAQISTLAH